MGKNKFLKKLNVSVYHFFYSVSVSVYHIIIISEESHEIGVMAADKT